MRIGVYLFDEAGELEGPLTSRSTSGDQHVVLGGVFLFCAWARKGSNPLGLAFFRKPFAYTFAHRRPEVV